VEAAGVEPDIGVENAQLIDSGNARISMISRIAKSAVRSLYSLFPEFPELPNLHLQTSPTLTKGHSEVRHQYFTKCRHMREKSNGSSVSTLGQAQWQSGCGTHCAVAGPGLNPRIEVLQTALSPH
jgi:hypothetical protein